MHRIDCEGEVNLPRLAMTHSQIGKDMNRKNTKIGADGETEPMVGLVSFVWTRSCKPRNAETNRTMILHDSSMPDGVSRLSFICPIGIHIPSEVR